MLKTDILIVGGGPAGITCGITARKNYPGKKIILVREKEKEVIPCAIPYIFKRLETVNDNLISDKVLKDNDIQLLIERAVDVSKENKRVKLANGSEIEYEKLVLATGSEPVLIPIKGIEKKGVFLVKKDFEYLKKLKDAVIKAKNIVIIGGGFIGVEFAEEISGIERKNISIIEKAEHCLGTNFDDEFTTIAEKKLKEKGVKIYVRKSVEEIEGSERVKYVKLTSGEKLPCDLLILSVGAKPNFTLAEKAGAQIDSKGGIWVDEYLKTNIPDIFAIGDCAQTKDFFTRRNIPIMLASNACYEARVAGANLYKIKSLRENKGTLAAFSTFISDMAFGAIGLTAKMAQDQGFDFVVGESKAKNHHPGKLFGARDIFVKLIFLQGSEGYFLGGEIIGPESVGEMINILVLAIQQGISAFDLQGSQIATHPLLTASPVSYPLIAAAQDAIKKM